MRHPDCALFLRPVDEETHQVPGYYKVVEHPMDFETICRRVDSGWYQQEEVGTEGKHCNRTILNDILRILI